MTDDEEESGVSRRNILFLTGTTTAATVGATWWSWPHLKSILGGRSESPERREIPRDGNGDDGVTPESGDRYGTWQDAIPAECELPQAYEDEVEAYVRDDLGMDSADLTEYVNVGRIRFGAESDGELVILADTDASGQYDTDVYRPGICG